MPKIKILDLFSGSKSVCKAAYTLWGEENVEYWGLDANWRAQPEILLNILNWDYKQSFSKDYGWDIIWASPPCTEYSRAKTKGIRDLDKADRIAKKALEIIEYFNPPVFFIENPGTGLLKTRDFMQPYERYRHTTTYCMYGTPYKKVTCIWTNRPGLSLPHCDRKPCDYKKQHGIHEGCAQNGPRDGFIRTTSRDEAYIVPQRLLYRLFAGINEEERGGPVAELLGNESGEPDLEGTEAAQV